MQMDRLRSWLFVPGSNQKMLQKARTIVADVVIIDLEDAVAPADKAAARRLAAEALSEPWAQAVYVRTNALDSAAVLDEVMELSVTALTGFVVPKVESGASLQGFSYLLDRVEQKNGLEPGRLQVMPMIETARGMENIQDIARASTRVCSLAFGAVDFALDIGVQSLPPQYVEWIQFGLVAASRSAGIGAPIDAVYLGIHDDEGLAQSATRAKAAGFAGKLAIHPDQVSILNQVFSPQGGEITWAKEVVERYEAAIENGQGSVQVDGKMVDLPVYELAKRLLNQQA